MHTYHRGILIYPQSRWRAAWTRRVLFLPVPTRRRTRSRRRTSGVAGTSCQSP